MKEKNQSSWEPVNGWYDKIVGEDGHYYHRQIILPRLKELFSFSSDSGQSLLDMACGQGILARSIPQHIFYQGLDISKSLIQAAKKYSGQPHHKFQVADITTKLPLEKKDFSHGSILLALQNVKEPLAVLKNFYKHLASQGKLVIVMNHPCFRIPRQTSWDIDHSKKIQYRRVDRYFEPLEIPIQTHPGRKEASFDTISYHHPLSQYFSWLKEAGFAIEDMQEWCSDKSSSGKNSKMENRSRREFPLFLCIAARKKTSI